MTYILSNTCAKNLCKRTLLVQLIIKNVVTFFWNTVCMSDTSMLIATDHRKGVIFHTAVKLEIWCSLFTRLSSVQNITHSLITCSQYRTTNKVESPHIVCPIYSTIQLWFMWIPWLASLILHLHLMIDACVQARQMKRWIRCDQQTSN